MTSISGFIDGILDGVIPPEQHKYYLQIVSGEVKRLSRLVNSLLDLSRIQAGERKFTPVSFDICEMGRQILISFEQKIDAKGLCVEFDCFEDRINVVADHDAIYQVFYNVCDNAVKFSSEGAKYRISIKKGKGKKIIVEVFNEGQGIPPEEMNFVFERFYKLDKSRGLNKNGTGLGLFIAKTIIAAQGESIWAESEYGKNCCFCFSLTGE
jgi:signal transduction histidine kinase